MKPTLKAKWDQAFANPGEKVAIGRDVVCDFCDKDWTDSPQSGGFLFGTYGTCPECAPGFLEKVKLYHEEDHIRATCPEGVSFADFMRDLRGPDAFIRVTTP